MPMIRTYQKNFLWKIIVYGDLFRHLFSVLSLGITDARFVMDTVSSWMLMLYLSEVLLPHMLVTTTWAIIIISHTPSELFESIYDTFPISSF